MPRNMILVKGNCACCGAEQIIELNDYSLEVGKILTLREYYDYTFVNINTCSNCGYTNDNIMELVGNNTKEVVNSKEYKSALDNGFMDGYRELASEYYPRFSAGKLDAMSMLYEKNGVENLTYAKIQRKLYSMKHSIRSYVFEEMCDSADEIPDKKYDSLIKKLSNELNLACEKGINTLTKLNSDNPYEVIFLTQLLSQLEQYDSARNLVMHVEQNYEFDEELQDYINEFLSEIKKV